MGTLQSDRDVLLHSGKLKVFDERVKYKAWIDRAVVYGRVPHAPQRLAALVVYRAVLADDEVVHLGLHVVLSPIADTLDLHLDRLVGDVLPGVDLVVLAGVRLVVDTGIVLAILAGIYLVILSGINFVVLAGHLLVVLPWKKRDGHVRYTNVYLREGCQFCSTLRLYIIKIQSVPLFPPKQKFYITFKSHLLIPVSISSASAFSSSHPLDSIILGILC
jgi:hypothetical protein